MTSTTTKDTAMNAIERVEARLAYAERNAPTDGDSLQALLVNADDLRTLLALARQCEGMRAQRDELRKCVFEMRDMLTAVHDGLEDESDRVYLGSSNHAELIHEAWHFADALKWDAIIEGDDPSLTALPEEVGNG